MLIGYFAVSTANNMYQLHDPFMAIVWSKKYSSNRCRMAIAFVLWLSILEIFEISSHDITK